MTCSHAYHLARPSAPQKSAAALFQGMMAIGQKGQVYDGFLQMDGSVVSENDYPGVIPFCRVRSVIAGGEMVQNSEIVASSNSFQSTQGPDKAFNGIIDISSFDRWGSDPWSTPGDVRQYLQAHFPGGPKRVNAYRLWLPISGMGIARWILYGSNDGNQWFVLDDHSAESSSYRVGSYDFAVTSPGDYAYYRIESQNSGLNEIVEMQFFVGADIEKTYFLKTSDEVGWLASDYSFFIKY